MKFRSLFGPFFSIVSLISFWSSVLFLGWILEFFVSLYSWGWTIGLLKTSGFVSFFGDAFEITYGQRPNHPTKPDPKTVYEVMESLNVKKEECIYVGDSDVDVNTAKNAGVKSVGVSWGFRGEGELREAGADYIIKNPIELIKLL